MRKFVMALSVLSLVGASSAMAATVEFKGDLNNRFMVYTDRGDLYSGFGTIQKLPDRDAGKTAPIGSESAPESWGEIKYRMWGTAATNDGDVKGVYAIEIGGLRYGNKAKGGAFSGDGKNVETRWAYTDFQLPGVEANARVRLGLQPFRINKFLWSETAMGALLKTDSLQLSWMRGQEGITASGGGWSDNDLNTLTARYDLKTDSLKAGFFGSYMWEGLASAPGADLNDRVATAYELKAFGNKEMSLVALGVDGSWSTPTGFGDVFATWNAIYETGSFDDVGTIGNNYDLSAYLAAFDIGGHIGKTEITYRFWYASGDDDATDQDYNGFMSVDVDFFDSIILMEGGYTDDNAPTEMPYLLDKGFIMNKFMVNQKISDKLKIGGAVLYMLTAQDVSIGNGGKSTDVGLEFDGYIKYKIYPNTEFAINAGYLIAGDAMDAWEEQYNGEADQNIFRTTARVRYKF